MNDHEFATDIFRELGNVGTGSASSVLADVMGERVLGTLPQVMNLDCGRLLECVGEIEKRRMGILFPFTGEIWGSYLFLLEESFVSRFLEKSIGQKESFEALDDYGRAAVNEVVNLMASSYFKAISSYTGLKIEIYLPAVSIDMTGAMLLDAASAFREKEEETLCIKNSFFLQKETGENAIIMLLHKDAALQILDILEVGT